MKNYQEKNSLTNNNILNQFEIIRNNYLNNVSNHGYSQSDDDDDKTYEEIDQIIKSNLKSSSSSQTLNTNINYLVSGSIAGMISRTATAGFERLTIIQQVQGMMSSSGPKYVGCLKAIKDMVKNEGFLSFFKGNGANIMKVSPNSGIRFLTYEFCKKEFGRLNHEQPLSITQTMASGGFAGLTSTFCTYPLDVVRTRLSLQGCSDNHYSKVRYKGVVHGFSKIYQEEGMRGLYKGLGTSIFSVAPWVSISFASYEGLKRLIGSGDSIKTKNAASAYQPEAQKTKDLLVDFVCGAFSGAFTMTVCYPLDVLRRRMTLQGMGGNQPLYKNGHHCFKTILKQEGVKALYQGITPAYFKVVPTVAISFAVYELCKSLMEDEQTN